MTMSHWWYKYGLGEYLFVDARYGVGGTCLHLSNRIIEVHEMAGTDVRATSPCKEGKEPIVRQVCQALVTLASRDCHFRFCKLCSTPHLGKHPAIAYFILGLADCTRYPFSFPEPHTLPIQRIRDSGTSVQVQVQVQ
jgi:hypothetical protein